MFNHDVLYQHNLWWEKDFSIPSTNVRRLTLEEKLIDTLNSKSVVFLTGLRRVGKTTLLKHLIYHLLEHGIKPEEILYISCDDYLLSAYSIVEILEQYRKIHRLKTTQKIYLFLDEITYKTDFQLQLKNIYDKEQAKIYVSSSSSSALSDQKGYLTGRCRFIEVAPLSFKEFLTFRNINLRKSDLGLLSTYFEDYMQTGGMPEYVLKPEREYLTSLVDSIIYKDIVAFHNLRHPQLLTDYFLLLMERVGKQISLNKIANILGISVDTAKRYLALYRDTFLIQTVSRYGKLNESLLSPQKIYTTDIGIKNIYTGFRDKGAIFENIIYSTIKAFNPRYVYENATEIDFITQNKVLIEAKYGSELSEKQLALFETFPAKKRMVVYGYSDLETLEQLVSNV